MAGRIGGPKTRNSGQWTEARFTSFVKGNLRQSSRKWGPIQQCLREARTRRGFYLCNQCRNEVPNTSIDLVTRKRIKNVHVDHIIPVIDPDIGWVSWDDVINKLFSERDNLQLLCHACHEEKTNDEKARAKARRLRNKEENNDDDE